MRTYPIKWFGSKLMIASKAVNTLPDQYLSYSRNARIFDGGIWPRRGKQLLTNSVIWTKNQWGFTMGGKLYQICNSKIYEVDTTTGVQTEKAVLGYDAFTDIIVYSFPKWAFNSLGTTVARYDWWWINKIVWQLWYDLAADAINCRDVTWNFSIDDLDTVLYPTSWEPVLNIKSTWTDYWQASGTWRYDWWWDYYISNNEYMLLNAPTDPSRWTFTLSVWTPCIAWKTSHWFSAGDSFSFKDVGGSLPTGLLFSTRYYVLASWLTADQFQFSLTPWWTAINTVNSPEANYTIESYVWQVTFDVWYYTETFKAIIVSQWKDLAVFDGENISFPATVPASLSWNIEYFNGYTFTSSNNILYISRPITPTNPEYSYDFTGTGARQITYDTNIVWLKSTLNWVYVFTEDKIDYLWANALQNVAGSATFITTTIGKWSSPMNNQCITADGERIFYLSKNLQVQTVNYTPWVVYTQIWELSARPVVSIKEFLNTIDHIQPYAYGFLNENDKTIQMHIRSEGSPINDYVLVYDLVNDTWNVDTMKNYNYVVKMTDKYYGFSDANTSIYEDDTGFSDAWMPIEFRIDTQNMNQQTPAEKIYGGLYLMWAIWTMTELNVLANIDSEQVFQDVVTWNWRAIPDLGDIWWGALWDSPTGGEITYISKLTPFDRRANEGRIFQAWKRFQISIRSQSQIQDFILDSAWLYFEPTWFVDISETW